MLSLLHEHTISAGDPKIQKLCTHLTQAASVPYMDILQDWVYVGVIQDPYEEVSTNKYHENRRDNQTENRTQEMSN